MKRGMKTLARATVASAVVVAAASGLGVGLTVVGAAGDVSTASGAQPTIVDIGGDLTAVR